MSTTTIKAGLAGCCAAIAIAGAAVAQGAPAHHPAPRLTVRSVAHHASPASARRHRSRAADPARPRETLFMTSAQAQALDGPYEACLNARTPAPGAVHAKPGQRLAAVPATQRYKLASARAQAACRSLDPLPPWQYDASNPKSMTFVDAVVACLHQHGVTEVAAQPAGPGEERNDIALGGPDNDSRSITLGLDEMTTCEHAALAAS